MQVQNETPVEGKENQLAKLPVDNNIAAMLCYVPLCAVNIVAGIVLLKVARNDNFLKHHALQGLVLTAVYMTICILTSVCGYICNIIPYMGFVDFFSWLAWLGATFVCLGLAIYGGIAAFCNKRGDIPIIAQLARSAEARWLKG